MNSERAEGDAGSHSERSGDVVVGTAGRQPLPAPAARRAGRAHLPAAALAGTCEDC